LNWQAYWQKSFVLTVPNSGFYFFAAKLRKRYHVVNSGSRFSALEGVSFFGEAGKARNLPEAMNLRGKSRDQIESALAGKSRSDLLDIIFSLVTVEQLLKPSEIAARSCLNKRAVLRDIRNGKFGDYFCRAENSIAVPASGVNKWRRSFRVPAKPNQGEKR
jgi:hypothetical protein